MILPLADFPTIQPPAIVIIQEQKVAHDNWVAEQARLAEEARLAELARIAEEARKAAEKALQERLMTALPRPNSFAWGNCTYFTAGLINIPWSGNANRWDDNARRMGYAVDNNPTVGSVFQTDAGWAGHVGIVVIVEGDNVFVREMNVLGLNRISTRWVHKSKFKYIHVPV